MRERSITHGRGAAQRHGGYHGGVLLAIDSSAGASTAVIHEGQVLASWRTAETNTHAEVLASAVQQVLEQAGVQAAELDGVVVGVGPGPFTGLRVGLALAHSLAEVWQKPLRGICSLDSIAARIARWGLVGVGTGEFMAVTDARRREIYWAGYTVSMGQISRVRGPEVCAPAEAPSLPAAGMGLSLYPEQLTPAYEDDPGVTSFAVDTWTPDAEDLGLLAESDQSVLREPLPLYLRESDAKVPQQMRRQPAASAENRAATQETPAQSGPVSRVQTQSSPGEGA